MLKHILPVGVCWFTT